MALRIAAGAFPRRAAFLREVQRADHLRNVLGHALAGLYGCTVEITSIRNFWCSPLLLASVKVLGQQSWSSVATGLVVGGPMTKPL